MRAAVFSSVVLLLLAGCSTMQQKAVDSDDRTGEAGRVGKPGSDRAEIYTSLAISYMRQNRLDIALQEAKKAVGTDPNSSNAHNVMGLIYQRLGRNALAEKHFKRALKLDQHNFYALNAFGSFLCRLQRYDEAYIHFDNAVKNPLNRSREVALTNAGICAKSNGDLDKAETYLRSSLQFNSRHAPALAQMAELSYERGDYQAARDYLRRYAAIAKHSPKTLWTGIRVEKRLGNKKALRKYRKQLRKEFPDSPQVRMLREMEKRS